MIGNRYAQGDSGYSILEEGDIDPATWQLKVAHYLVCRPDGSQLPGAFTWEEACRRIEELEAAS